MVEKSGEEMKGRTGKPGRDKSGMSIRANLRPVACALMLALWAGSIQVIAQQDKPSQHKKQDKPRPDLTEISMEDLMKIEVESVYGASRYMQKVTEAPASITIISADEIKKYGYRTLADILRSIRGVYVTSDRNYSYIGIRGVARPGDYNTRVLLLVDGHRINDPLYDQATLGTEFPLDVDLIERVEFVRGPSSSIYGTNAFFGIINIIPKRGRDLKGIEVSGEAGSFSSYKGRISYGNIFKNGAEIFLSASLHDSQGNRRLYYTEFDDPTTNNGIAENADQDSYKSFFANVAHRGFTLQGVYSSRDKSIPTGSFGTVFNDVRNYTVDRRSYLDLKYERDLSNRLGLMARLYYDHYHYDGDYVYSYSGEASGPSYVDKDHGQAEWWGGEVKITAMLPGRNKVTVGSEYRDNAHQNQKAYSIDGNYVSFDDRRSSNVWALYLQDELTIRPNLILSAGVRYDNYSTFGGTTNPRLGLIYSPTKKTSLKFLYGQAFRAPNAYELFYGSGFVYKSNHSLRPETIKTSEIVWEQYAGDHLRFAASGFYSRIDGLINQITDPADGLITFRNIESIRSKGFELEMQAKLHNGMEGRAGYTLQKAENSQNGETLTNSPCHLLKANWIAPIIKEKFFAGLDLQYTSRRETLAGNGAKAFWLPNLTLSGSNLFKRFDVSVGLYNLFDKKYGDPGAEEHRQDVIRQDGRNFRVKITWRFNPTQ